MRQHPVSALFLAIFLCFAAIAGAQESTSLQLYADSVKQPDVSKQLAGLERYLVENSNSSLRNDAMTIVAWDYIRLADRAHAADRARQLWVSDDKNPVALAVLLDTNADPETVPAMRLKQIQAALATPVRRPEGLREIDYAILKQYVWRSLSGSAGLTYIDLKDYATAAGYLQRVVEAAPDDPRYVFGLGNALSHMKGHDAEAFWYLARAVNLSSYSPQGQEIATYARQQYHHAGGNDKDWDAFLTAASSPRQTMAPVVEARKSGPPVTGPVTASAVTSATTTTTTAQNTKKSKKEKKEEALEAENRNPNAPHVLGEPLPSEPLKPRSPSSTPVSLGILLQTAKLDPAYRKSIVFALSDLVRNLRQGDEAFILAFSNQLDFVQDLTDNAKLLEEAMDEIKPAKGAALFDAVAFASGHLKRIAKNQNRVLLVISDGSTSQGQASSFDVSASLNQVRIDCIGVDVNEEAQRALLRNLALYSGGQTAFINGAPEFRATTRELAKEMGISFPQ